MIIEPGSKILRGVNSPHDCVSKHHKYNKIRGTLIDTKGRKIEYNFLQCDKCGIIAMRGDKWDLVRGRYANYDFVHIPKRKKEANNQLTKKQKKNLQKLWDDAMGVEHKKKGKKKKEPIPPVYPGEEVAPPHVQQSVFRPYSGGSFTSK